MSEIEKHEGQINFEEDDGHYLIKNAEIELIPLDVFEVFSQRLRLQAASYGMDLDFEYVNSGILISWSKSA